MVKRIFSYSSIPFFLGVLFFLTLKLSTLSIRLSDSNIYFMTAARLWEGSLLYRDIFFTNFPLHPYFSVVYYFLLRGDLHAYFFTSALEVSLVSIFIFYILLSRGVSYLVATLSAFVYLFSVLVLVTSDHQTGVFLASLFAVLSYLFYGRKQYVAVGIFCALMLLVKAYFLPVALTYGVFLLLKRDFASLVRFVLGGVVTCAFVLLPFLLFAGDDFVSQVFGYSLTRGAGISKFEIAKFYIFRDILLFGILVFNLFLIRKRPFWGLFSLFSLIFFFLYQDIYYLYLNFTAPFAALSFPYIYRRIHSVVTIQSLVIPTILAVFFAWNVYVSYSQFSSLGRVESIDEITKLVRQERPDYVYGNNDIAPAISYLSGVPQLNAVVDTNENMFRIGVLDAEEITNDILDKRTLLILHSAYYPQMGVANDTFSEIVEGDRVQEHCNLLQRFQVNAEGVTNALAVFRCY